MRLIQDLFIKEIQNAVDRLWFDASATQQDMSDAEYCFILDTVSDDEYDRDGLMALKCLSAQMLHLRPILTKAEKITVGEFLYKKPITKTLCLMSDGSVLSADDAEKAAEKERFNG